MRPATNLLKNLHLGVAALAAGSSLAAALPTQAQTKAGSWTETDASLTYIRNATVEIEKKTGMPLVAINGTEAIKPITTDPIYLYLLPEKDDVLSKTYMSKIADFFKEALKTGKNGEALANVYRIPGDKIYLVTEPETELKNYVAVMVPYLTKMAEDKKISLEKFLGPLTADDFVAFSNYHETRHTVQEIENAYDQSPFSVLYIGDAAQARIAYKKIAASSNRFDTEADSFAALKFVSDTPDREDVPRRIAALKGIAKIRLLGVTSGQSDTGYDTYDTLSNTIRLIENAHNQDWAKVQAQFGEMYQNLYPEKDIAQTQQMARSATKFVARQDIRNMSDDQYRDLSAFMSRAYAPKDEQLLAMSLQEYKISSNEEDQAFYKKAILKIGDPTAEGRAYVDRHVKLADDAIEESRIIPAPSAKPRVASLGMR
jgi:hypothetical protein